MKKKKNKLTFLQIIVLVLLAAVIFTPEAQRYLVTKFAIWGAVGALVVMLLSFVPSRSTVLHHLNRIKHNKTAKVVDSDIVYSDTEELLWRQISFQITGKLQAAFPDATWDFTQRPDIDTLMNGTPIRIRTNSTSSYNFAEINMNQHGALALKMMTIESLKSHGPSENSSSKEDLESWYTLIGKDVLVNCIGDLQARGFQKAFINENGEIYTVTNNKPDIKSTFDHIPSKEYWDELSHIFCKDELHAEVKDSVLELSWSL